MIDNRAEKFVLKTLPGYFFKNQDLTSLVTSNASAALVEKLKKILPRLTLSTKKFNATAGLYVCDHFKAQNLTQSEILALSQKVVDGGVIFVVSHRDWGVKRVVSNLEAAFGQENVEVLERGMAGFRMLGIRSFKSQIEEAAIDMALGVEFSVKTPKGETVKLNLKSDLSLFSAKKLDEGTRLMLETIDFTKYQRILEIGCGWGAIGITALVSNPKARAVMTDIEPRAVAVVEQNLTKLKLNDRGQVLLTPDPADVPGKFDLVVSNPPYHADNEKVTTMFTQIKNKLSLGGSVIIGTDETFLPKFSKVLEELGFRVSLLAQKDSYRVMSASLR